MCFCIVIITDFVSDSFGVPSLGLLAISIRSATNLAKKCKNAKAKTPEQMLISSNVYILKQIVD